MPELLSPEEGRVLGCLLEKEATTPEYYPLTLNALRNACNQSSSRHPVVSYDDGDVSQALASLREKGLIRIVYSQSNRAAKYRHVLDERLGLDQEERALICLLLLRGPQTVGELRTRSDRLAPFESLEAVDRVLVRLAERSDPLAARLDRAPGQKEARHRQLLAREAPGAPEAGVSPSTRSGDDRAGPPEEAQDDEAAYAGPGGAGTGTAWGSPGTGTAPDGSAGRPTGGESPLDAVRAELSELRAEIAQLRSELDGLRRRLDTQ